MMGFHQVQGGQGDEFVAVCMTGGPIADLLEMLEQGTEVDVRGPIDYTGLIMAADRGHREIVVLLLDRGANVNAVTAYEISSLMVASRAHYLDIVEILVARGANIHHVDKGGHGAMDWAARFDHMSVCEFLISKGSDLMALDSRGFTALDNYGGWTNNKRGLSPETKALRCAALEAVWAAGPHPTQVRRRLWERRGPLLWVLAEHAYRPLQHRALAIALAAASLDPAAPIEAVALTTKEQRHAFLLGRVFSNEGLVRLLIALL